ncbi:MAG: bifunctional ornithine acetyltransferase/N-acetylglutamate synthase [Candidatus Binatia bacterium]
MQGREFTVDVDLAAGAHQARLLTTDLGVDYVRFNSEYSS